MPLIKANSIKDIFKAFDPSPLDSSEELQQFYVSELNEIRGSDKMKVLALGIRRRIGQGFYKAFVMGHSGVGISTELTRLQAEVSPSVRTLRLSANTDLDPVNFKPFDLILRIALGLAEETAKPVSEGGAGSTLPADLTRDLLAWFHTEKSILKTQTDATGAASLGASTKGTLWEKFLGVSVEAKTEIKRASGRSNEIIEYREKNVGQLADLANRILDDCNQRLKKESGHEWLVIGDDFDKPGIPEASIENTFIKYGSILGDLRCHLIMDVPIGLGHSSRAVQLPPQFEGPHNFPDTPVYKKDHTAHKKGREALRSVITHRMDSALFDKGQQERVIVASGGNLRDLFTLIVDASTNAELRDSSTQRILANDVDRAINSLRKEYRDHLGETAYDVEKTTQEAKLAKLVSVYLGKPEAELHDSALYSLLHGKAVQEFNGISWFGVHPLIVDFLSRLDRPELKPLLDPDNDNQLPGGSI